MQKPNDRLDNLEVDGAGLVGVVRKADLRKKTVGEVGDKTYCLCESTCILTLSKPKCNCDDYEPPKEKCSCNTESITPPKCVNIRDY